MSQEQIDELGRVVDEAKNIVCFTGAGISTESGIPDFRSPGTGLWTKMKPIQFQDFIASDEIRQTSWRNRFESTDETWSNAKPNKGHIALAKLIEEHKCSGIITQNVDNLHQDAGVPDDKVVELHGNNSYAKCLDCHKRFELAELKSAFAKIGRVEPCSHCAGIIKTATISFGQSMPEDEMRRAQHLTEQCDLMIVLGSSLSVYPAAGFPEFAKRLGAKLAIVNREDTPLDPIADVLVREQIGPTMAMVVGLN